MIGIVVPTLGTRPDYLRECLHSISKAGTEKCSVYVVVVAPKSFRSTELIRSGLVHAYVEDPGRGLAEAINTGFAHMPDQVKYINWLADDDLLKEDSLHFSSLYLNQNPETVMVFGDCEFIDPEGRTIWTNKPSEFAVPLLRVGPDLIPQPGALFKRESFNEVSGLDSTYKWAFDFDLFLKLTKQGRAVFVDKILSSHRWHATSLTYSRRWDSVREASLVRFLSLPSGAKYFSPAWEVPIVLVTYLAGHFLSRTSLKSTSKAFRRE